MTEYGDIYLMRSKGDNIPYVGITINKTERWQEHIRTINNKTHRNIKVNRYCKKYNRTAKDFYFSIIEKSVPIHILGDKEKYWILYFDSYRNGFNCSTGGNKPPHHIGENHPAAKLNENIVRKIINDYIETDSYLTKIAQKYNVSYSCVSMIIYGNSWKHITSKYDLSIGKRLRDDIKFERKSKIAKEYLRYNGQNDKSCVWNNIKYKSQKEAAEANNIDESDLSKYIKRGYKNSSDTGNFKKILYGEIGFYSRKNCAKFFGITPAAVGHWLKSGKAQYVK